MFACVNVLHATPPPALYLSIPFHPSSSCESTRKASITFRGITTLHFNLLATNVKAGHAAAAFTESAPRERRKQGADRRAWGHRLGTGYRHGARPCQRRVTLSYRDTQARAAKAVGDVAASGGDAGRTLSLPHCLLVVRRTDRQDGAPLLVLTTNFK